MIPVRCLPLYFNISEKAGEAAEAALKLGHGRVGLIVTALERAVDRSEDKILKHIDVFRVNDLRLDLDALDRKSVV